MSGGKVFLDTNVFVYMYDASEPKKKEISLSLLDANDCVTSTQTINELSNVLTKKFKTPISNAVVYPGIRIATS
ncbi:MAG: PIN domain-containing protein [Oscillospiraceae bacterium]|nr:PIN domain-containing protein [Oscillospiraceae bacterium]